MGVSSNRSFEAKQSTRSNSRMRAWGPSTEGMSSKLSDLDYWRSSERAELRGVQHALVAHASEQWRKQKVGGKGVLECGNESC